MFSLVESSGFSFVLEVHFGTQYEGEAGVYFDACVCNLVVRGGESRETFDTFIVSFGIQLEEK